MKKLVLCLFFLLLPACIWAEEMNVTLYNNLSENQREYYLRVFDYVMDNSKDNKPYHWKTGAAKGDIRVSKEYTSKLQSLCRNFTETFEVDNQTGKSEGVACKRDGDDGWCRLKNGNAHTCAMEEPRGITNKITNDADSVIGKGNEIIRDTTNWWNR